MAAGRAKEKRVLKESTTLYTDHLEIGTAIGLLQKVTEKENISDKLPSLVQLLQSPIWIGFCPLVFSKFNEKQVSETLVVSFVNLMKNRSLKLLLVL